MHTFLKHTKSIKELYIQEHKKNKGETNKGESHDETLHKIKWPNSLKTVPSGVATYPSAGGRRGARGMRLPRKEYVRSRHQRLFEENVGKTGKDAIYELFSERFGSSIYARGRY